MRMIQSRGTERKPLSQMGLLLLLLGAFVCSMLISACVNLKPLFFQTIDTAAAQADAAMPEVLLSASLPVSAEALSAENQTAGGYTVRYRQTAALLGGGTVRIEGLDGDTYARAFILREGRMPQNASECVVVPCARTGYASICTIGAYLRAADASVSEDYTVEGFTVVGIGENAETLFSLYDASYTSEDAVCVVYTYDDAWTMDAKQACAVFALSEDTSAAMQQAVSVLEDAGFVTAASLSAEEREAQQASLSAQQVSISGMLKSLREDITSVTAEAETLQTALLDALAVLDEEQQSFEAEMAKYDYYATRQTTLMDLKEAHEKKVAAAEVEIEDMRAALSLLYTEKNGLEAEFEAQRAAFDEVKTALAALSAEGDTTEEAAGGSFTAEKMTEHDGYRGLLAALSQAEGRYLPVWVAGAVVYGLLVCGVFFFFRGDRRTYLSFGMGLLPVSLIGAWNGAVLLTEGLYTHDFPEAAAWQGFVMSFSAVAVPVAVIMVAMTAGGVCAALAGGFAGSRFRRS